MSLMEKLKMSVFTKDKVVDIEDYFEINGTYKVVDGLINVTGDVKLIQNVDTLPCKFGVVTGYFSCPFSKLTSLTGSPKEVGGEFYCYKNKLTSLTGAPKVVGGSFDCEYNKLTSLTGAPTKVGGNFYCSYNKLKNLTGAPNKVGGGFYCSENLHSTKEYKKYLIIQTLRD